MGAETLNGGEHAGKVRRAEPLKLCPCVRRSYLVLLEVMGNPEGLLVVHDHLSPCIQILHILQGTKQPPFLAAPLLSSCPNSGSYCNTFLYSTLGVLF